MGQKLLPLVVDVKLSITLMYGLILTVTQYVTDVSANTQFPVSQSLYTIPEADPEDVTQQPLFKTMVQALDTLYTSSYLLMCLTNKIEKENIYKLNPHYSIVITFGAKDLGETSSDFVGELNLQVDLL